MQKTTVIGIAGGTGSGKTTVVKKIAEALPPHYVAVVPLDMPSTSTIPTLLIGNCLQSM